MTERAGERIAVVIPCFNDGHTLPDAVASVFAQEPCELVVVDDGSTDHATLRAFDCLPSHRLRVIHQVNRGLGPARMTGVRATSARYIFALDADDYLVPGALTILADYLDAHENLGLVWGRYRFAGEKTHEKDTATVLDPWQITYFNDLPVAALIRRDLLQAVGGWQLRDGYEDLDLWMTFAEHGVSGRGLSTVVHCHRIHGRRMARSCIPRHAELCALLRARHRDLFAARSRNRTRSPAPRVAKVIIPLLDVLLPCSEYRRMALSAHVYRLSDPRRRSHYLDALKRRFRRLARTTNRPAPNAT